jgi:anaerobic selenocysteine-containing dehydrogenase
VPFIVSFSSFLDDTTALADLILPDHSFLERWTDANPESGAMVAAASHAGPVMRPIHNTRATPDVLFDLAQRLSPPLSLPWKSFEEMLAAERPTASTARTKNEELRTKNEERRTKNAWSAPVFDGAPDGYPFHLLPYASTAFYDGSSAHLPWLQEMPDPMTSAMWSNWVEINPRTAERLQVATGDFVEVTSQHGSVRAPVVITPGIAPDVVSMPVGQGHERFTRYAGGRGSNPISILAPVAEPATGTLAWAATRVKISRAPEGNRFVLFAGGDVEHVHEHR